MERCINNLIYDAVNSAYISYIDLMGFAPGKLDKLFKQLLILNILKSLFKYIKATKNKYFYFNKLEYSRINFSDKLLEYVIIICKKINKLLPIYIKFTNNEIDNEVLYAQYLNSIIEFDSFKRLRIFLKNAGIKWNDWNISLFM